MHEKQHSSYTETFSLLLQTQRQSLSSCHNMPLLIPLSPQSKSGFHLSQNSWDLSSCATSIRVSLNVSWESHSHVVRCGDAPNAVAPEAYQCRCCIKQGLLWLVLERQHIGKRKMNVLTETTAIQACHLPSIGSGSQCQLYRDLHVKNLWRHVGVYMDLRIDMERLQHLQLTLVRPFIHEMQACVLGHLQLSLHLASNEVATKGKKRKGLLCHRKNLHNYVTGPLQMQGSMDRKADSGRAYCTFSASCFFCYHRSCSQQK